jgi:hypothetical protein
LASAHVLDYQVAAHHAKAAQRTRVVNARAKFRRASAAIVLHWAAACSGNAPSDSTAPATQSSHANEKRGAQGEQATSTRGSLMDAAVSGQPETSGRSVAAGNAGAKANAKAESGTPSSTTDADQGMSLEPMGRVKPNEQAVDPADDAGVSESSARRGAGTGGVGSSAVGVAGDAASGAAGMPWTGGFGGGLPFCVHPPDCVSVITSTVGMATCCPNNGESCGYSVLYPGELDDGTCRPNSAVFLRLPGQAEERVESETEGGAPDQLITPECETRSLLAFTLPGCCMPDNRCGVSTYHIADILLFLGGVPAPFTRVQCTSVEALNLEFRLTPLAGLGQIPPSDGACDYEALDAKLPHKARFSAGRLN